MKGLEPSTFCMASAGERSRSSLGFAKPADCSGSGSGERTAANPNERRVQPLQTLGTVEDVDAPLPVLRRRVVVARDG
jgi:hypothetical protein